MRHCTCEVPALLYGAVGAPAVPGGADGVASVAEAGVTLDPESRPVAWWTHSGSTVQE